MPGMCATRIMHSQKAAVWPIHKMSSCFCCKTCDPGDKFMNGQPSDGHLVKEKRYIVGARTDTTWLTYTTPSVHYTLETIFNCFYAPKLSFATVQQLELLKANVWPTHVAKSWKTRWYSSLYVRCHVLPRAYVRQNSILLCLFVWLSIYREVDEHLLPLKII